MEYLEVNFYSIPKGVTKYIVNDSKEIIHENKMIYEVVFLKDN